MRPAEYIRERPEVVEYPRIPRHLPLQLFCRHEATEGNRCVDDGRLHAVVCFGSAYWLPREVSLARRTPRHCLPRANPGHPDHHPPVPPHEIQDVTGNVLLSGLP